MEIDLLALALRHQHAGFPQHLEVVGTVERARVDTSAICPTLSRLTRLEGEEDALPVFVTEGAKIGRNVRHASGMARE